MRLIALVIILVILKRCFGECEYSESELNLTSEYGILKPKNYPSSMKGGQTCTWSLPIKKYKDEPLFIYIDEMDIVANRIPIADVQFGDEPLFSSMPLANCRLYGVQITDMDLNLMNDLIKKYKSEEKYCTDWSVSEKEIETVTFRSFRERTNHLFRGFKIIYDYKVLRNMVRQTTSITRNTPIQRGTTSSVGIDETVTQNRNEEKNNNGYTVAIVLLVILLIVISAALAFVMYKLKKANKTRYSFTTTISPTAQRQQETTSNIPVGNYAAQLRPENYADPMYQAASEAGNVAHSVEQYSDPYAFVEENSLHASTSNANPNVFMYDVPTNNRERVPTATSVFGIPSEQHCQEPPNEDITRDQSVNSTSLDVYAVVQKGKNKQN